LTNLLTLYPTSGAFSKNAIHWPDSRKHKVKNAWANISGKTNCKGGRRGPSVLLPEFPLLCGAHLVELVAKIDGVDVVAFQVREHDDLQAAMTVSCALWDILENALTKNTIEKRRAAAMKTAKRKSHAEMPRIAHS
jgi:hypothetical protein